MKLLSSTIPYLLLVSFYSGQINDFDMKKIQAINVSPYHGVAVQLIGAYDTATYEKSAFKSAMKLIKKESKKDIWPWVFFNRFIGYSEKGRSLSSKSKKDYFRKIRGMDIYEEFSALRDFYDIWKISLSIAKELGSPGIVVDPEPYNNYKVNGLSYVAQEIGKPEDEIKIKLENIGSQLISIANEIYPRATIWFLYTGIGKPLKGVDDLEKKEYRKISTYIIRGMLKAAKENRAKLRFVSGGEVSLGYCYMSLDKLRDKIQRRNREFSSILKYYPNLNLGGTIAPWDKPGSKKSWLLRNPICKNSELKTIGDFRPLISQLLESYNYVWIYGAMAAGYDPYNSSVFPRFNRVIEESIALRLGLNSTNAPDQLHILDR